jgi:nucleoside-diphosphate-sugar epimerase
MFYSDLTDRLLSTYDQIIIYGAKGWIGRSAINVLFDKQTKSIKKQIVLIGSKSEQLISTSETYKIYSANESEKYIGKNCIFLNAAYLRQEKLKFFSQSEFIQKNNEIMKFGEKLLKQNRIKTFINLSSGVASKNAYLIEKGKYDVYASCKINDEMMVKNACDSVSATLINCRIYTISGRFLNEFENLALSEFIKQAIIKPNIIRVKSEHTLRTYLDSIDLVKVLFELSLTKKNYIIDSGGFLIKLGQLADEIAAIIPESSVEKICSVTKSADYFGDFQKFNELATKCGIELLNIDSQITETLNAFR